MLGENGGSWTAKKAIWTSVAAVVLHAAAATCAAQGPPATPSANTLQAKFALPATSQPATAPISVQPQSITLDGASPGRRFDGIGGVSSGGSSRLLFDYPEPARSDILDYLFKPGYGAALQMLKVEIGGDGNATAGAEPSHMRRRGESTADRGYVWWLMKEAQKRNPDIVFIDLEWSAPGWFEGRFWSDDNVSYILDWIDVAQRQGLKISYVGGWNERKYNAAWYGKLHAALQAKHAGVKVIAADEHAPEQWWRVAQSMTDDPAFNAAVDVVGTHSPGGWRSQYQKYEITPQALALGKPLWNSEQSALGHDVGAGPWARGLNRAYIDARITSTMAWAPISAWYANLPLADTGFILAEWPWSGFYKVGPSIWVNAHTAQFAQPGWRYADNGCGYLSNHGSIVTYVSPDGHEYSSVVETMDATEAVRTTFTVGGGLSDKPVHVWSTDLRTDDASDDFIEQQTISPFNGRYTLTFEPGHVYSITTTTGQGKGRAAAPSNASEPLPLPFFADFDGYKPGQLARYFSDVNGGFETVPAAGGRPGLAYRQMVDLQPINWNADGLTPPTTLVGDPRWWGDYEVSVDVFLEQAGFVELVGRVAAQRRKGVAGYHLQLASNGTWKLYSQDLPLVRDKDIPIASGSASFEVGRWHSVALRMKGGDIAIVVDGKEVGHATDTRHTAGNVALRVSGWQNAQFDNFKVTPTAPPPAFVPNSDVRAVATSERTLNYRGRYYAASDAVDDRPESFWHTEFEPKPPLPQSITLDLGSRQSAQALAYQPRIDNATDGMITRYVVNVSADGKTFTPVAAGEWDVSTATKVAAWPTTETRYVRLEAVSAVNGMVTAGEIRVATSPMLPTPAHVDAGQAGVPAKEKVTPDN